MNKTTETTQARHGAVPTMRLNGPAEQEITDVKRRFLSHQSDEGFVFEIPNRVDLLAKPRD